MYTYYFFDLDGTLTDPMLGITNSVMYALAKRGIACAEREKLYSFIGPPLADSFSKYYGMNDAECASAIQDYREYFRAKGIFENEVYPGTVSLLEELRRRGKKIVLATSKPEEFSLLILEHFDLLKYFDFVAGALMDETRNRKNEVIAYALSSLGIDDLSSVLMIGDRKHDIIGARLNGIASAGVLYGYGSREELASAGADYIIENMDEILNI